MDALDLRNDDARLNNLTGPPVRGDDFFGRRAFMHQLLSDLDGNNLLLLAPRRVGKTSILLKLGEVATSQNFSFVYLDVSGAVDELGLIEQLVDAVLHATGGETVLRWLKEGPAGAALAHIESVSAGPIRFKVGTPVASWRDLGENLTHALGNLDRRLVVAIDELPVMVLELLKADDGATRVRRLLNWFRHQRQRHPNVRWLLAGSIGLDTVAKLHNLQPTINDLKILSVDAFDPETADSFLERLSWSYSLELSQGVKDEIVERLGWALPYFLQLVFSELRQQAGPIDKAAVGSALHTLITKRSSYFEGWYQRLDEQLGPERAAWAEVALSACAKPGGASLDTLTQAMSAAVPDTRDRKRALEFTLSVLTTDGYVVRVGERVVFRSPLLRAWWERYHGE